MKDSISSKQEFVQFLLRCGVLKFGDFVTKSGRRTPYFINTGEFRTGSSIAELAQWYARTFEQVFGDQADNLYGPAYKGIPLCAVTAMSVFQQFGRDVSFTYNRKEAKDHGEGGLLVGDAYKAPRNIVIIEDVITAGTSVRETLQLLQSIPNAKVIGLIVSVDRREKMESGISALQQVEQDYGLRTAPIIRIDDIIDFLRQTDGSTVPGYDSSLLERMLAYRQEWGA